MEVHDRIIGADPDQSVVTEDAVAECREFGEGVPVIAADGSAGNVSAGHDQAVRHAESVVIGKEKMLEGGIGKHDPDLGVSRCNSRGQKGAFPAAMQCPY